VATVSRINKIVGLACRILAFLQGSFAKETFNFIDPTNQSHPISSSLCLFCHVLLKRDQLDWDWRIWLNDTPHVIGCDIWLTNCDIWLTNLRLEDLIEWHSTCNRLYIYTCSHTFGYLDICMYNYIFTYIYSYGFDGVDFRGIYTNLRLFIFICIHMDIQIYSQLHWECDSASVSNLILIGLFSTERGKRDLENKIIDWDLRKNK